MLENLREFIDRHEKLFGIIFVVLVFLGGFLSAYGMKVNEIQDQCNQFIIDNYYTEEVLECLGVIEQPDFSNLPYNWTFEQN